VTFGAGFGSPWPVIGLDAGVAGRRGGSLLARCASAARGQKQHGARTDDIACES
jgi:hypothetical protein